MSRSVTCRNPGCTCGKIGAVMWAPKAAGWSQESRLPDEICDTFPEGFSTLDPRRSREYRAYQRCVCHNRFNLGASIFMKWDGGARESSTLNNGEP